MDHSAVTTFFEIKRASNTSSTYNHWSKHTFHGNCGIAKQGKHHHRLLPGPSLALLLPLPSWFVYMTMGQNSFPPNFKNFFNHMEFNPNWSLSQTLKPTVSLHPPIKWLEISYVPVALLLKTLTPYLPNKNFSCQLCGPSTPHSIQP